MSTQPTTPAPSTSGASVVTIIESGLSIALTAASAIPAAAPAALIAGELIAGIQKLQTLMNDPVTRPQLEALRFTPTW